MEILSRNARLLKARLWLLFSHGGVIWHLPALAYETNDWKWENHWTILILYPGFPHLTAKFYFWKDFHCTCISWWLQLQNWQKIGKWRGWWIGWRDPSLPPSQPQQGRLKLKKAWAYPKSPLLGSLLTRYKDPALGLSIQRHTLPSNLVHIPFRVIASGQVHILPTDTFILHSLMYSAFNFIYLM